MSQPNSSDERPDPNLPPNSSPNLPSEETTPFSDPPPDFLDSFVDATVEPYAGPVELEPLGFVTHPYIPPSMYDPTPTVTPLHPGEFPSLEHPTRETLAVGEMAPFPFADRIPGYRLQQLIGRGGLGSVFRALHRQLGLEVAIKILHYPHARHAQDPEMQQVLYRLGRLRHPHLVATYGTGQQAGYTYFVMEHIAGPSLQALPMRESAPLPFATMACWMEQVARGAHYLHEQGIVHRDIKPGNILIDPQGQARLADYGLATLWPFDTATIDEPIQVMGTPAFMAPEQAAGLAKKFGPTLDVWALGSTLFWMLTGQPPFRRPSVLDIILALHTEEAPDPTSLRLNLPAGLVAICRTCLRREISERYPSALAVAEELQRYRRGERLQGITRPSRRPWWAFWRAD